MSRCVLPIIFSVLCPWQGKGLPLSDGKREGRASRRCDLDGCSHLEGVRATARNTQVSSASDTCPVLWQSRFFASSILCRAHFFFSLFSCFYLFGCIFCFSLFLSLISNSYQWPLKLHHGGVKASVFSLILYWNIWLLPKKLGSESGSLEYRAPNEHVHMCWRYQNTL